MADPSSSSTAPSLSLRRSLRLSTSPDRAASHSEVHGPTGPKEANSPISSHLRLSTATGVSTRSHSRDGNSLTGKVSGTRPNTFAGGQSYIASALTSAGLQNRARSRQQGLESQVEPATLSERLRQVKRPRSQVNFIEKEREDKESEQPHQKQCRLDIAPKRLRFDHLRNSEPIRPPGPQRRDSAHGDLVTKRKPSILKRTKTYTLSLASRPASLPTVQFPPTPVTLCKTESDMETDLLLPSRLCDPQLIYKFRRPSLLEEIEKQKQMTQFKQYEMQAASYIYAEWPVALPPPDVIRYGDLEPGQQRFGQRFWLNKWGPYAPRVATGVVEAGYAVTGLIEGARGLAGRLLESMISWNEAAM